MKIESIKLVYFSPTGTTKTVLEGIAKGIMKDFEHVNLTLKGFIKEFDLNELTLIGVPVYGGRIPFTFKNRLKGLKANEAPAIVVTVYGNRAFEDALLELRNNLIEIGFKPIAGAVFIGEHSYSTLKVPIAHGRPDKQDLTKAFAFGQTIREKIEKVSSLNDLEIVNVPGNFPYKKRREQSEQISPDTIENLCIKCGKCERACPTGAIKLESTIETNAEKCIRCCACVKVCPTQARRMEHDRIKRTAKWLFTNYSDRREPEIYL